MQHVIPFWCDTDRTPVVQMCYHGGVVGTCHSHANDRCRSTEHAHAADRFAHEIIGFLTLFAMRLRRLMGNPLGGRKAVLYHSTSYLS